MKKNRLLFLFGILLCYSTLIGKNGAEVERIKSLISEAKALKSTNIIKSDSLLNVAFAKTKAIKNDTLLVQIYHQQIKNDISKSELEKAEQKNNQLEKLIKPLKNVDFEVLVKENRGLIAMQNNDLLYAIKNLSSAVNHYFKTKNWDKYISASSNLAWCYYLNGQNQIAIPIFKKIIPKSVEINYNQIGKLYQKLGIQYNDKDETLDSAIHYLEIAGNYFEKEKDQESLVYLQSNLGGIYLYKQDYTKALKYFELSYQGFQKLGYTEQYYVCYNELGITHLNLNELDKSEFYLLKALNEIAVDSFPTTDEELIKLDAVLYYNLCLLYAAKKDYKKAYEFLRKERSITNAKNRDSYQKEIMDLTKSNEMVTKENEIIMLKENTLEAKIKQTKIVAISVLTFLFLFGLTFFLAYKNKIEKKQLLTESIRLKNQAIKDTLDEERKRISRDLHDNIGSYAATIIHNVESVNFANNKQNETVLTEISINAQNVLNSIRDTFVILNNKDSELTEIVDRFKNYCNNILRSYPKIKLVVLENHTPIRINAVEGVHLTFILKELFNNSIKHSGADSIKLSITEFNSMCYFEYSDDGIGFDLETVEFRNGLENIKYRAEQLNATLNIVSALKEGVKVAFTIKFSTT